MLLTDGYLRVTGADARVKDQGFHQKEGSLFHKEIEWISQFVELENDLTHPPSLNPLVNIWFHWAGTFTTEEFFGFQAIHKLSVDIAFFCLFVCFRLHVQHAEEPG